MNYLTLLGFGIGLSFFLSQNITSPIVKSPLRIDLENGLVGYPRIQIEDRNQLAPLVIVLHGRGSDQTGLQKVIPKNIPARIIFLRGQIDGKPGRYFFNARLAGPENELVKDLEKAGLILDEAINKLTQIYPTNKIILFGFSQGAALSLYIGSVGIVDSVIAFSGSLPSNLFPNQKQNTKILMWHGNSDKIVPYKLGQNTADAFKNAGFLTEFITGNSKGHILPPNDIVNKYFKIVI
jgi:predicted esterase